MGFRNVLLNQKGVFDKEISSPYLFLICAEGLFALIRKAESDHKINGLKLCPGEPTISHLLFAEDSLVFFKAKSQQCREVHHILSLYECVLGQKVNFDKSNISFSKGVRVKERNKIICTLKVKEVGQFPKHLGMPSVVGKSKKSIFKFVEEKILKRIGGWKEKLLSKVGREVLIKAIMQAAPLLFQVRSVMISNRVSQTTGGVRMIRERVSTGKSGNG